MLESDERCEREAIVHSVGDDRGEDGTGAAIQVREHESHGKDGNQERNVAVNEPKDAG